ncbi:MAG: TetR/AcrR family transcriptional regulator [Desulfobacterales bacterium]|nr:TetR/AcrR family transcriptional regulator [Desulfobacterales bacterium]
MKKMEKKREQKRQSILRSAQEAFQAGGYAGVSMDLVARNAGMTKQTLYRYYPSKEALYQATLDAAREESRDRFLKELELEDTQEALTRFAIGFLRVHLSEGNLAGIRLLMAEGPEAPEMARAHYAAGPEKVRARLAVFLRQRSQIRDPELAAEMLLSTLLSRRMTFLTGLQGLPAPADLEAHGRRTVRLFMELLD